jgi:carbonic anhydrase
MPEDFHDILEANAEYARSFDLQGLQAPAARELGVLTCIDSRIEPLPMLGLRPGDAKIFRNAGARVTRDVLRTLSIASHLLAVRRIMVVAHTDCAMATTDDELRARMLAVHPELEDAAFDLELRAAGSDPHATLRSDLERLRSSGVLAPGTVVGGFEYDVHTGLLRPLDA